MKNVEAIVISIGTVIVALFLWESFLKAKLVRTQETELPV